MEFRLEPNQNPLSDGQRAQVLANPGFGEYFSDHMVTIDWTADLQGQAKAVEAGNYLEMVGNWSDARVEPYGPLPMKPAAAVLHYAQEIFEEIGRASCRERVYRQVGADCMRIKMRLARWCVGTRFFFSSRRRHTRWPRDWSSDVCSSDLPTYKVKPKPSKPATT